jgi:hypothetical protein
VLGIPAGAVAAADIHIDEFQSASARYTPTVRLTSRPIGYRLGTGQLIVDLRQLPWAEGPDDLGFGPPRDRADDRVVPANVCIDGDVHRRRRAS